MLKTTALVGALALLFAGCATIETLELSDPATALAFTVTLSPSSSFRYENAERAQALVSHLGYYGDGWRRAWGSRSQERYRVDVELSSGESLSFSVNTDSITLREGGARMRILSEDELRKLDLQIIGEEPYRRFPNLDFVYPGN